jgi:hypothetical protein
LTLTALCKTMTDYQNLSTERLVDLLAQETQKFTQLILEKRFNHEYDSLKNSILNIQAVLELRKEQTISEPSVIYTPPDISS